MSNHIIALTVIFDEPIPEDDIPRWIDSFKVMRGVIDVQQHVQNIHTHVAYTCERAKLLNRMRRALEEI